MIKTMIHETIIDRDEEVNTFINNPYTKVFAIQTNIIKRIDEDRILTTIFYEKQKK